MRFDEGDEFSDDSEEAERANKFKRRRARRMKTRAWRRAQKDRMRAHAKKVADYIFGKADDWKQRWLVRHTDNIKTCSCWMCCNRRKIEGLTLQEQRAEYEWKELDEWFDENRNKAHRIPSDEGWQYISGKLRRPTTS